MANKMLIDATHPEETRVVVLRGNRVEEFDFETAHRKQLRGNIYLAKVTRVEPSLQAAFVDYGGNRHGFLAFSEIHPDYYQIPIADRQALIDDDARAARESDADDEVRGRGRRSSRRGERAHKRPDETVKGDTVDSDLDDTVANQEFVGEATEPSDVETVVDEPLPLPESPEQTAAEPAPTAEVESASLPAAIGETELAPSIAEAAPITTPEAITPAEHAELPEVAEPVVSAEIGPDAEDIAPPVADPNGAGAGENGAEEEEEVVESIGGADALEEVPVRAPRYRRQYKIQEVIKRRQVLLVQVVKEERGTKGAALTTYLSLAGRYCVLMPNTARGGGISRKITSIEDRKKLREIAEELEVPEGMGVILRTAGANRTKAEVKRDFEYLLRLWEQVRDLTLKSTAPTLVYEEGSLAKRSIRDLYSKDIDEIIVSGDQGYRDTKEFMRMLMPSHARNVKLYKDTQPIFTRFGIESQLDAMFSPTVQLRSGGYIVINQTEALVAIDVNSGRSTREHHIEDTALKTNVEAAEEVARQLRLRDLAGLIVIDFIDMDEKRNNRTVERRLKEALRHDRARIQVGRISHFGLLEMSRQRIRASVLESSTEKCPHCGGTGHVRSVSSMALQLLRSLEDTLLKGATHNLIVRTRPEIALYVLNHKRAHLIALENRFRIAIAVEADSQVAGTAGFAVDRGEQVMSLEQAKALLAQTQAAPEIYEEEEPEPIEETPDDEIDGDAETEPDETTTGAEESFAPEEAGAGASELPREGEPARDGGRRRRRRRGRGRGGDSEGRRPGAPPREQFAQETTAEHPIEHGEDYAAGYEQPSEHEPADTRFAPEAGSTDNGHPEEDRLGGERRRRRRGRRGGRRSRRDREGQEHQETAGAPISAWPEQSSAADYQPDSVGAVEQPSAIATAEIAQPAYAPATPLVPATERAEAQSVELPTTVTEAPATPPAAEPPRRRSTVREPAPVFDEGTSSPPHTPTPQPPAAAAMVVTGSADSEDENKPRRTGWWSRRILGGGKG
jgi:ribonuclease E